MNKNLVLKMGQGLQHCETRTCTEQYILYTLQKVKNLEEEINKDFWLFQDSVWKSVGVFRLYYQILSIIFFLSCCRMYIVHVGMTSVQAKTSFQHKLFLSPSFSLFLSTNDVMRRQWTRDQLAKLLTFFSSFWELFCWDFCFLNPHQNEKPQRIPTFLA